MDRVTVTLTPRFGVTSWSAGTDPFTRAQRQADNQAVENFAAIYGQGTLAARPASGKIGRYYYATDTGDFWYDTGTSWIPLRTGYGTPGAVTPGAVAAAGSSTLNARADHVHSLYPWATSSTALTVGMTGGAGSALTFAHGDHSHSMPASAAPGAITAGAASAAGVSANVALADHAHGMYAWATNVPAASGGAGSAGSAATMARGDHSHPVPTSGSPLDVYPGRSAGAGVATTTALSDHSHATYPWSATAVDLTTSGASSGGASNSHSRGDHAHALPGSIPRGRIGVDSSYVNFTGPSDASESPGLTTNSFTVVSGRRYRIRLTSALIKSDGSADTCPVRLRLDSTAGTVLYLATLQLNTGYGSVPVSAEIEFVGGASTVFPPVAGTVGTIAAGSHKIMWTFIKGSGSGNASTVQVGPTSMLLVDDIGT